MSETITFNTSQTDWEIIDKMADEHIDLSDIPEVTTEQMAQATRRIGGRKPVNEEKIQVVLQLDADVVAYFKAQAGSQPYQRLINETLKESIQTHQLESMMRRVIREEIKALS